MATLQDIRRRIRSVSNTQKITKAMELVAGSRLRRAQARIEALRPYADSMQQLMLDVAAATPNAYDQPLLAQRDVTRVAVIAIAGDRGLAGAFNASVVRRSLELARESRAQGNEVTWLAIGRRGASSLRFRRQDIAQSYTGFTDRPTYADAQAIAERVAALYSEGEVDRVVMVYNHFISPLQQRLDEVELLPVPDTALAGAEAVKIEGSYEYEPDVTEVLNQLVPAYLEIQVYRALLESTASEHGARMTAMRNASENAGVLIDDYTLKMNRARQAAITQEILEVVAGADALQ